MNLIPNKAHLTALDILIELRCWLADNVEMQAEPAIVAHLPNGYLLTQSDCVEAIDALLHQLRQKEGQTPCDYLTPIPLRKTSASYAMA